jgi:hypothetical protein
MHSALGELIETSNTGPADVRSGLLEAYSTKHKSLGQKVSGGEHPEKDGDDNGSPHQGHAPAHKSSRMPLKKGWRTLPSAGFARYSISASSDGSTQMPRCAIFLALAEFCGSAA